MIETPVKLTLFWTEEQEIFRRLYQAVFNEESPVEVVGTCPFGDFEYLKNQVSNQRPQVLLIGCRNISTDLLRELHQLQSSFPTLGVVLLASVLRYEDLLLIRHHIENSKSPFGFLFKKSLARTEQLYSIISLVRMGQIVIDPILSNLISSDKDKEPVTGGLTPREMEILNLVARGYTNLAISDSLCIDVKTVGHHITNIYSKIKTTDVFDNRHPRVSATNVYLRLTGQLAFNDNPLEE
jgi:DNA-binding NarL/FixJ family response regulator